MSYLGVFGSAFKKPLSHLNHYPVCTIARVVTKINTFTFGIKNIKFWVFLGSNLKILLSYWQPAPSNLLQ